MAGSLGVRGSNPLSSTKHSQQFPLFDSRRVVTERGTPFARFAREDYWPVAQLALAPRTRETEAYVLNDIVDAFGLRRLDEITPKDCAVWWARYASTVAPATANHRLVRLRHLFRTARDWGIIADDPTHLLKKRPANGRTRRLRGTEREQLLAHANEQLKGYILGALYTGMRRENLWSLRERDLDLAAGTIVIGRTKNGDPLTLPLHSQLRAYLEPKLTGDPEAPVFYPYREPHEITQAFRRLCSRLGIANLHFHDLRHEVGSKLGEAFANQSLIMATLGHRDVRSSSRYVHVGVEAVRKALEAVL